MNCFFLCLTTFLHVGDVYRCLCDNEASNQRFAITAKVSCVTAVVTDCGTTELAVEDNKNAVNLFYSEGTNAVPVPGDTILANGVIKRREYDDKPFACITKLVVLAHGAAPLPRRTTVREMSEGRVDCRFCRLHATIREIAPSPYAAGLAYLTAVNDGYAISIWSRATKAEYGRLRTLIGKEVDILGFCTPINISELKYTGRQIRIFDPSNIRPVLPTASETHFPSIDEIGNLRPSEIDSLGLHCATGCVCATWQGNSALLKNGRNFLQAAFIDSTLPAVGDIIEVIGFPESNFFRINLVNARWRKVGSSESPENTQVTYLNERKFRDDRNNHWSLRNLHGKLVKVTGRIISCAKGGNNDSLVIKNDITSLEVELPHLESLADKLTQGCVIEATGICVIEAEAWHAICPKLKRAAIVPRSPADVRILSKPSWWTPQRLLIVISGLFICLIGILFWNVSLRKAALRKGHQLAREQLKLAKAQLKTSERTRLAVELHDSLAQNLMGVSLEVDSVLQLNNNLDAESLHHMTIASLALQSCCADLRNSIWDLRNEALDTPDLNAAIRQTVSPHIGTADLKIRFNVSRKALDENLLHAVLRIIRELSINAVRHGDATVIHIAGSMDERGLHFCVRDNGRGFDLDKAPGITEGHFGLQGVRERIKDYCGQLQVNTAPGTGTKITITMKPTDHD